MAGLEQSSSSDGESAMMRSAGLNDEDILHLAALKKRVSSGIVGEKTPEHKRLEFARYLFDSGRLSDDLPGEKVQDN